MNQYFPKPCKHSRENLKVELDLFNYAANVDLKLATCANTSSLVGKYDLVNLKAMVDQIDADKLN